MRPWTSDFAVDWLMGFRSTNRRTYRNPNTVQMAQLPSPWPVPFIIRQAPRESVQGF
jgi:hypothetical protein